MSSVKIAEARAVKKIVKLIRAFSKHTGCPVAIAALEGVADDIEDGLWKDVKLPKLPKKEKKRKK